MALLDFGRATVERGGPKIILFSGGMDSLISYRLFCPNHIPVFLCNTSSYNETERRLALRIAGEKLRVVHTMPHLQADGAGIVPHRNALMLSYVASYFKASEICVSAPRGEMIYDQQPAFYKAMNKALLGTKIINPIGKYTKAQAIAKYIEAGYCETELRTTRSCYHPTELRCGACTACVKRWVAMANNRRYEAYRSPVRHTARQLAKQAKVTDLFRMGWRPMREAVRAYYGF